MLYLISIKAKCEVTSEKYAKWKKVEREKEKRHTHRVIIETNKRECCLPFSIVFMFPLIWLKLNVKLQYKSVSKKEREKRS